MPPKGKLSKETISDLENWINDGASWPMNLCPVCHLSQKGHRLT